MNAKSMLITFINLVGIKVMFHVASHLPTLNAPSRVHQNLNVDIDVKVDVRIVYLVVNIKIVMILSITLLNHVDIVGKFPVTNHQLK